MFFAVLLLADFLTPAEITVPARLVQGVRQTLSYNYQSPGIPVTPLRLERTVSPGGHPPVVVASTAGQKQHAEPGSPVPATSKPVAPATARGQTPARPVPVPVPLPVATRASTEKQSRQVVPATPCATPRVPVKVATALARIVPVASVYFPVDVFSLTRRAKHVLAMVPAGQCYLVVGHADPRPVGPRWSYQFNLTLSLRRAHSTAALLGARGIRATVEAVGWKGASRNPDEYRQDRRVDVFAAPCGR